MAEPSGSVQECVEAYLFARNPTRILLFRRPPDRGGIWVPVSGKVEPSDRDFEAATLRELREETGLAESVPLDDLSWEFGFTGPDGRPWRLHAFAIEVIPDWKPVLSAEHDAFAWVTPEAALRRLHYPDNQEAVRRLLARLEARQSPGPPQV